jgi:flagellar hook-length control protein FliK
MEVKADKHRVATLLDLASARPVQTPLDVGQQGRGSSDSQGPTPCFRECLTREQHAPSTETETANASADSPSRESRSAEAPAAPQNDPEPNARSASSDEAVSWDSEPSLVAAATEEMAADFAADPPDEPIEESDDQAAAIAASMAVATAIQTVDHSEDFNATEVVVAEETSVADDNAEVVATLPAASTQADDQAADSSLPVLRSATDAPMETIVDGEATIEVPAAATAASEKAAHDSLRDAPVAAAPSTTEILVGELPLEQALPIPTEGRSPEPPAEQAGRPERSRQSSKTEPTKAREQSDAREPLPMPEAPAVSSSQKPVAASQPPVAEAAPADNVGEAAAPLRRAGRNDQAAAPAIPAEQSVEAAAANHRMSTPLEPASSPAERTADATPRPSGETLPTSSVAPATGRIPALLTGDSSTRRVPSARPAEVDPARFLARVARAFESAQQRDGEVRLRLHPAELGSLSIVVKVQEGGLMARVQAETPEARLILVDNLPQLRERLAEQGIRIDQFDVDLRDHSDRQGRQPQSEQSPEESAREAPPVRTRQVRPASDRPGAEAVPAPAGNGRLNVVI